MAGNKTRQTGESVEEFISAVDDERKRADAAALVDLMRRVTGEEPAMWGPSIVGFGETHYVYESGREGDWFKVGFSPRKAALTLYLMSSSDNRPGLLDRLGKHTTGKGCLYIKRLEDVDVEVLEELVTDAVAAVDERYA